MPFINIEIKAKTNHSNAIREYLLANKALYRGTDEQTDTYFNVPNGRLKLREGKIENNLIFYQRANQSGPKQSNFQLHHVADPNSLRQILISSLGIKVEVKKKREIYFIDNVKFHLDTLEFPEGSLQFVEIEAGNKDMPLEIATLHEQCSHFMKAFGIKEEDLITESYSDMVLRLEQ